MKVSKEELSCIARRVLDFLDTQKVDSPRDLNAVMGRCINFENPRGYLFTVLTISNHRTLAHTLSYYRELNPSFIPLDAKVNFALGCTKVFVKYPGILDGYSPFALDRFGNLAQEICLNNGDVKTLKEILRALAS